MGSVIGINSKIAAKVRPVSVCLNTNVMPINSKTYLITDSTIAAVYFPLFTHIIPAQKKAQIAYAYAYRSAYSVSDVHFVFIQKVPRVY